MLQHHGQRYQIPKWYQFTESIQMSINLSGLFSSISLAIRTILTLGLINSQHKKTQVLYSRQIEQTTKAVQPLITTVN